MSIGGSSQKSSAQSFYDPQTLATQRWLGDNTYNFATGQGAYQPYSGQPLQTDQTAAKGLLDFNPGTIAGADLTPYTNPFTSGVIDTSMNDINHQKAIADQQAKSEATQAGAWGGDGASVLRGLSADSFDRAQASTAAQLHAQNFSQAQGAAQQDIANRTGAAQTQLGAQSLLNQGQQADYAANFGQYTNAQNYQLQLRQLLNQAYGLLPSTPLQTSSGSGFGFSASLPAPTPAK